MKSKDVIKAIYPYVERVAYNGKHYKAYVGNNVITISSTSSDRNFNRQVYRDFRRIGIIIKELL